MWAQLLLCDAGLAEPQQLVPATCNCCCAHELGSLAESPDPSEALTGRLIALAWDLPEVAAVDRLAVLLLTMYGAPAGEAAVSASLVPAVIAPALLPAAGAGEGGAGAFALLGATSGRMGKYNAALIGPGHALHCASSCSSRSNESCVVMVRGILFLGFLDHQALAMRSLGGASAMAPAQVVRGSPADGWLLLTQETKACAPYLRLDMAAPGLSASLPLSISAAPTPSCPR
jgi:hypothetical protein